MSVWWAAALSILLGGFGQLCFRRFGQLVEASGWAGDFQALPALAVAHWWVLVAGVGAYVVAVLLWLRVLSVVSLGRAYPVLSLGYVVVLIGAVAWLGEAVSWNRLLGTLLVVIGVVLAVGRDGAD